MPKCILHVGMHKTGTTSIQNSLQKLDDDTFYYARLRDRPNHSLAVNMIFAKPNDPRLKKKWFTKGGDVEVQGREGRRDLNTSVVTARGRTLVLSGEGMLRMPVADLNRLKNFMNLHGYDDIEVIAYIRPPMGYISSAVQQHIKTGNQSSFNITNSVPDYKAKFSKFDEVFGPDKVRLFKFDPNSFPGRDVVADFCAKAGIPLSSIVPVRKNESITRLAAQLRFQYTVHAEAEGLRPLRGGAIAAALCERLLPLDPTRFRVAPSVLKPVADSLKSDIEWMEKRLGQPLQEDLRDEPGDVRTEEDLLQPVPGINQRLLEILAKIGEPVPEAVTDNTYKLLYLIALADRQKQQNEMGASEMEIRRVARRAARREQRKDAIAATDRRKISRQSTLMELTGEDRIARRQSDRQSERKAERKARRQSGRLDGGMFLPQKPHELSQANDKTGSHGEKFGPATAPAAAEVALPPRLAVRPTAKSKSAVESVNQQPQDPPAMTQQEQQLMRSLRAMAKKGLGEGRKASPSPLTMGPTPFVNKDKKLIVLWSPKSACTTMYVWFSYISGFSEDVRKYATWPHRHRMDQYMKSKLYAESIESGMADAKVLRVIRDPYGRAVSIYRHALQTLFADRYMEAFSNGRIDAKDGYSFQTFLDLLEQLDMRRVDVHFRPQFHPLEKTRAVDRVINISKSDLFTEINAFEAMMEIPKTNFEDLNWLHALETKRKAKQEPIEGDGLDHVPFSRQQAKMGQLPSYDQLLTPLARQRIEAIYKADFDAYGDYL